MYYSGLVAAFAALTLLSPTASAAAIKSRGENQALNEERAEAVKEAFTFSWDGYYKYAFPNDELHPVSNSFSNSRNAWGASAIDAFSTALVMKIPYVVDQIQDFIPTIDFGNTTTSVSLFETTIRYLGGLLSGYDLLNGPLADLAKSQDSVNEILKQAVRLADNMAFAFETPSGVPSNDLNIVKQTANRSDTNGLATVGTLVLEWTRLSDITGDDKYAKLSQKAENYLLSPKPATSEPWPGLVGFEINVTTGEFKDARGGWVGGADSFYEYLIKMWIYDSSKFATYRDRWIAAADSSIAHLASHPSTRPDLTFLAQYNNTDLIFASEHLACFDGGSFILGGLVLKEQKYIDFGLELVNGCEDTYSSTVTGIGPEVFRWVTDSKNTTLNPQPPASEAAFYEKAGFFITGSSYVLRPEVMESFYYAYRATGDQIYREWAWNAFLAINATCRIGSGFAELNNVNEPGGGGWSDFQDSFWFAEVLKYSYLIHAPDDEWQVQHEGVNKWIFNTEAHPIRVVGPPI